MPSIISLSAASSQRVAAAVSPAVACYLSRLQHVHLVAEQLAAPLRQVAEVQPDVTASAELHLGRAVESRSLLTMKESGITLVNQVSICKV